MSLKKDKGGQQKNCFVEVDLFERIKREAKHKKVAPEQLANQYLRSVVFKSRRDKREELKKVADFKKVECPSCGYSFVKGQKADGASRQKKSTKKSNSGPLKGIFQLFARKK